MTSGEGELDIGASYCRHFLRLCGRYKSFTLLPLVVAEMVKSGKFGEVEIVFLECLAQFAITGFAAYNLAGWIDNIYGGIRQPDFSWISDR